MDLSKPRYATTTQFLQVHGRSLQTGYNRLLEDEFLAKLDPDGRHVVSAVMVHEHIGGKPAPPHLRCHVMCKVRGKTEPARAYLDVSVEDFESLPLAM